MPKSPDEIQKEIEAAVAAIADPTDTDIFFYSGPVYAPADARTVGAIRKRRKRKNLLLVIYTLGGDANAAYRMARCFQNGYANGKFSALIHSECKSAGTLMALSADELIMCDLAELGPLDVQVMKQDELFERSSGLTPVQALNSLRDQAFNQFEHYLLELRRRSGLQVSTRLASHLAAKMVIGLLNPIYQQIDPIRLGETQRAMMIAQQYGERLGQKNLKDDALEMLVAAYPSHDFIIDFDEAKTLFRNVRKPTDHEERLTAALTPFMKDGGGRDGFSLYISREMTHPPTNRRHRKGVANGKVKTGKDKAKAATPRTNEPNRPATDGSSESKPGGTGHSNGSANTKIARSSNRIRMLKGN